MKKKDEEQKYQHQRNQQSHQKGNEDRHNSNKVIINQLKVNDSIVSDSSVEEGIEEKMRKMIEIQKKGLGKSILQQKDPKTEEQKRRQILEQMKKDSNQFSLQKEEVKRLKEKTKKDHIANGWIRLSKMIKQKQQMYAFRFLSKKIEKKKKLVRSLGKITSIFRHNLKRHCFQIFRECNMKKMLILEKWKIEKNWKEHYEKEKNNQKEKFENEHNTKMQWWQEEQKKIISKLENDKKVQDEELKREKKLRQDQEEREKKYIEELEKEKKIRDSWMWNPSQNKLQDNIGKKKSKFLEEKNEEEEEEKDNLFKSNITKSVDISEIPWKHKNKFSKIDEKKRKLELKNSKNQEYLNMLKKQAKEKEKEILLINKSINFQQTKEDKLYEGDSVSLTESISLDWDISKRQQNGFAILQYIFDNHKLQQKYEVMEMFFHPKNSIKKKSPKKIRQKVRKQTYNLDNVYSKKLKEANEEIFNQEEEKKEFVSSARKYKKENTDRDLFSAKSKGLAIMSKFDLIDSASEGSNKLKFKSKNKEGDEGQKYQKLKQKVSMRKELRKKITREDNKNNDSQIQESEKTDWNWMEDQNENDYEEEEEEEEDEEDDNELNPTANSKLTEYDKFYKELFFRNEIFKVEPKVGKDTEEDEIIKEIQRTELKKKIQAKTKEKETLISKGWDVSQIETEIETMKAKYDYKKQKEEKVEWQMNNTDAWLYKGRLLFNYFNEKQTKGIPKFSIESEKNVKGKEIIDFKGLSKEETIRRFYDKCICFKCRRAIYKWLTNIKYYLLFIINNNYFDWFSLLVIITNTILIFISDPRDENSVQNITDDYFWYFYTFEAFLKILSFGFVMEENAYWKDYWNILDFFVILLGWVSFIVERVSTGGNITGLAGWRAFRILRPLKAVKSIKGLKNLVIALWASIAKLVDTSLVLFFFFLLFAIAGVQMWQGWFLKRCMSLKFGYFYSYNTEKTLCSFDSDCEAFNEPGNIFVCAKGYVNPNNGVTTYDNTLLGFITVFIIATMEGWTDIYFYVSATFKDKFHINQVIIFLYFHFFIFVGGFYLINLFLAVTNSEFTKIEIVQKEALEKKSFYKLIKSKYDLREKEKQEKKRKEKELKVKNQDKNGESLKELKYKIDDEAFHIHKNTKEIPINYSTVKDIYILQNNNPEEIYTINGMIDEEESFLKKDIKLQIKNIDNLIYEQKKERERMLKQLSANNKSTDIEKANSIGGSANDGDAKFKKRKATQILNRPIEKINQVAIEISISNTEKYLKEEMINLQNVGQVSKPEQTDRLKQKIEKKEIEKFNMGKISIMADWSFEKEKREKEEQNNWNRKNMGLVSEKKGALGSSINIKNTKTNNGANRVSSQWISNEMMNEIKRKNKYNKKIEDDWSFMTDLSISNNDSGDDRGGLLGSTNLIAGMVNPSSNKNLSGINLGNMNNSSWIDSSNNNSITESNIMLNNTDINNPDVFENNNSVCALKKININLNNQTNQEENINYNEVAFQRPKASLPEWLELKNDKMIKEKMEKLRKQFNINDFLTKEANNGTQIASLGRRRSFLQFLQFNECNGDSNDFFKGIPQNNLLNNKEKSKWDISLYHNDENWNVNNGSFSNYQSQNISIPLDDNKVYDEDFDMDEIVKKIESNKYSLLARKSFLEKKDNRTTQNYTGEQIAAFYTSVNSNMNDNIIIDTKEPRCRGVDNKLSQSHVFLDFEDDSNANTTNNANASAINVSNNMINPVNTINRDNISQSAAISREKSYIDVKDKVDTKEKDGGDIKEKDSFINTSNINNKSGDGINANFQKDEVVHIFRTKSIDKNLWKYPQTNSKDLIVEDHNKKVIETLTPKQELIPNNLRGKKYYMNYWYNILDKDWKVKDTFNVDQWRGEVLGREKKQTKIKPLPESIEAVYVFNEKSLNLKKYRYLYNVKFEYLENEVAYLTHNLKNLPISILELMPQRIRAFGKDFQAGALPLGKSAQNTGTTLNAHLGDTATQLSASRITKTKSSLTMGSAFTTNKIHEEIKYKKGFYEKVNQKIEKFNYRTLSHYFLDEESLQFKMTDEKRREDKEKEMEDLNRAKGSKIEVKGEIRAIKVFDWKTNSRRYCQWSGQDVWYTKNTDKNFPEFNKMIQSLEEFGVIIWKRAPGVKQWQKLRYGLYLISTSTAFDLFIMFLVIANSVIMALDGNIFTPELFFQISLSNFAFNGIFIAEFLWKLVGLGPIVYFSDAFTYLDLLIIAFAILDMSTTTEVQSGLVGSKSKNLTSQLSFLRVFRIFRVLRLTKILRRMKSMRLIIVSIKKSLKNVAYIILILIMFLLIFQLWGMSLLNGDRNYQSFWAAFYITFQVLTQENWNNAWYELFPLSPFVFFYYLIWIFIGNYIVFNLFISILLRSFDGDDNDEDDDTEDEIIEKRYVLPNYFEKWKEIEKEHKNRLKQSKKKKAKKIHIQKVSTSNSQSRIGSSTMSGSTSENNSSSSMLVSGVDTEGDEVDESTNQKSMTVIDRSWNSWKKINILFRKNECEWSLYLFSQTNRFRISCMKWISNKKFDTFILIVILLSTIRLIADTFVAGYTSVWVFDILDVIFNMIFIVEMVLKVISLGFIMDEGTYIRDSWNQIDFVIVIVSLFDFQSIASKYFSESNAQSSLNFLKVLRLLRTLRPLRFISHNPQLKLIITSLFDSIVPIINALFIVIIVFFMFSIVGMNLFYSLFHNCYVQGSVTPFKLADSQFSTTWAQFNVTENAVAIQDFCGSRFNGILDTGPNFKFSNLFISLVTSYVLGNMEGWPDIMNSYLIYNSFYGWFFVVYLLVVSYFFLNLFTGIMFKYFNDAWSREKKVSEDDKHGSKYYDFLQQIELAEPDYISYFSPPPKTLRYYLLAIASSKFLDTFIMVIIILNMIVMAISFDNSGILYSTVLDDINWGFTAVFMAEWVLKMSAYGIKGYFYFGWNRFDCFVVAASIVDLIFANIDGIDASFLKSFQIIRVLRVLRVTRVLRLIKSLKSLEKLIQTLRWSVTALSNVFIWMFLIFCIFAILGFYWYDGLTFAKYGSEFVILNSVYNFDNFYNAFVTCFRCATGEDWPSIMLELAYIDEKNFPQYQSFLYMIFMNFITAVIMLNLFLMVTLQQYNEFTNKTYNPVEVFESFLWNFQSAWNKYSNPKDNGYRIKKILITNFFLEFQWKKLRLPEINKTEAIKKFVSDLKWLTDHENYVYFHDVVFKVATQVLGSKIDFTQPEYYGLYKEEKKIGERIMMKTKKFIQENEKTMNVPKSTMKTFNPLTSHLYYKISYWYIKTFINYYKENADFCDKISDGEWIDNISKIDEEENTSRIIAKENDKKGNENKNEDDGLEDDLPSNHKDKETSKLISEN